MTGIGIWLIAAMVAYYAFDPEDSTLSIMMSIGLTIVCLLVCGVLIGREIF